MRTTGTQNGDVQTTHASPDLKFNQELNKFLDVVCEHDVTCDPLKLTFVGGVWDEGKLQVICSHLLTPVRRFGYQADD